MTTMYTYLVYPPDIFRSPNNYVKVKMVQICSRGNENIFHETYITQFHVYNAQFRWSTPYQLNFFIHLYKIMAIFKEFMHCVNIPFHSQILHLF
jgi:hypothetical protein